MERSPQEEKHLKKEELRENHWYRIAERIYEHYGAMPDPAQIRAWAIRSALEIPAGEISALGTNREGARTNPEADRTIAEQLTNKAGVWIDREKGITSCDFRDLYPDGLPQEITDALPEETVAIMEAEYAHARDTYERFGDTKNLLEADMTVEYYRLPGGVDLFLRGYAHNECSFPNEKEHLIT